MITTVQFADFYHNMTLETYADENKMHEIFAKNIVPMTSGLSIGRLNINDTVDLFLDPEGYEEEGGIHNRYVNPDRVVTGIHIWRKKGSVWTEEDKKAVQLLAESLYIFGGRFMMLKMAREAAMTDRPTGIPNVIGIKNFAEKRASSGMLEQMCCFFINLKNFKLVNRQFSTEIGDIILKQFSEQLFAAMQSVDGYAGRLGGDNFVALVEKSSLARACEKITSIHASVYINGVKMDFPVKIRAGYSGIGKEGVMEAVNMSNIAMQYARRSNQELVAFETYMLENTMREKKVSESFSDALKNKEFVAFYQPKVDSATNTICGAEALVRWVQPGRVVPPMEFIPTLEREGSICLLDFYMLDLVCRHIRHWMDAGIEPVRVSVNFSKHHLQNENLVAQIVEVLQKHRVPSKYIEIELTEMSDYEDFSVMKNFVDALKSYGIESSIDDFGTGYSSLTLLRDLAVETVKLDRSFVVNLQEGQEKDKVMIESIAHLVKAFGMTVLVEGVETWEQYRYLKEVGCNVIQGYLFDRPMNMQDFTDKLISGRLYGSKE